jgi:hypothetical protein
VALESCSGVYYKGKTLLPECHEVAGRNQHQTLPNICTVITCSLEIASLLLLVAIIGAVVMAKKNLTGLSVSD